METSFNGADFEQTNRFQFRLNIIPCRHRRFCASVCTSAPRVTSARITFVDGAFSALSYIPISRAEADSAAVPPSPPLFPPAASVPRSPLDCIDHRWRGCTRRKRLVTRARRIVTSMASSHIGITHIHGSHVIFPQTRLRLFGTNSPLPLLRILRIRETVCHRVRKRARVRFRPFHFPASARALGA